MGVPVVPKHVSSVEAEDEYKCDPNDETESRIHQRQGTGDNRGNGQVEDHPSCGGIGHVRSAGSGLLLPAHELHTGQCQARGSIRGGENDDGQWLLGMLADKRRRERYKTDHPEKYEVYSRDSPRQFFLTMQQPVMDDPEEAEKRETDEPCGEMR